MPPTTNTDRIRDLEAVVARLELATERLREELDAVVDRETRFAALDKSHALLQQSFEDHKRRAEFASKWFWGLAAAVIAGLIVALATK